MLNRFMALLAGVVFPGVLTTGTAVAQSDTAELIGHWKLAVNALDASGAGGDGTNHGVKFEQGHARFDGRSNYVEVADPAALELGTDPFSIAAWVRTDAVLDDVIGDVISRFDAQSRTGFMLNIKHNVGATNSQANYRQLQFGIDSGSSPGEWRDCGRPGEAVLIFSMATFDGQLYAGTGVAGADSSGRVFRYDGDDAWIDCGALDKSNSVSSLAVYEGKLYAGTAKYRLAGSALTESENLNPGGSIFRYEGGENWVEVGKLPEREGVNGLVVYKDKLYASSMYAPAGFFRYDGDNQWTDCGVPDNKRVEQLSVYNGDLFATSYDGGFVYRYDGDQWTDCGQLGDNTQTYAFAVNEGQLYVGTWPSGKVFRYVADHDWQDVGRLGEEKEVMGMAVYNGKMYAGTLPLAEVFRYDGDQRWTSMGRVDLTPDVKYRRAWTMAVYQGRLFVGTLPSGKVMSLKAGEVVTLDRPLPAGWVHVAAVKGGDRLKLYVNGELVASSEKFDPADYDLSSRVPLKIGFGPHDYFNGSLSDVRVYRGALSDQQIGRLASENRPGE